MPTRRRSSKYKRTRVHDPQEHKVERKRAKREQVEKDTQMTRPNIEDLPAEIKAIILSHMDPKTCKELSLCNKSLHQLYLSNERIMPKPMMYKLLVTRDNQGDLTAEIYFTLRRHRMIFVFREGRNSDRILLHEDIVKLLEIPKYQNIEDDVWPTFHKLVTGNIEENFKLFASYLLSKVRFVYLSADRIDETIWQHLIFKVNVHGRKLYYKHDDVSLHLSQPDPSLLFNVEANNFSVISYEGAIYNLDLRFDRQLIDSYYDVLYGLPFTFDLAKKILDHFSRFSSIALTGVSTLTDSENIAIVQRALELYKANHREETSKLTLPALQNLPRILKATFGSFTIVHFEDEPIFDWDPDPEEQTIYLCDMPDSRIEAQFIDEDRFISWVFIRKTEIE